MRDIGYETSVIRIYPIKEKLDLSSSAKATLPALWLLFICKTDLHKIGSQNKVHSIRTQTNVPWRGFFLPCPGRQNKLMEASNNVNHIHDFPRSRPSRWVNMISVLRWVIVLSTYQVNFTLLQIWMITGDREHTWSKCGGYDRVKLLFRLALFLVEAECGWKAASYGRETWRHQRLSGWQIACHIPKEYISRIYVDLV